MPKSLSPSVRRQIIEYDPIAVDGPSVSEFCQRLGISRPSFYNLRRRFIHEGNTALNPRSSAPINPVRIFDSHTTEIVLRIRARLKKEGWDHGPKSIWFTGIDTSEFTENIPSVATIARILASSGVTNANPRKRPRSAWLRFSRAAAMEMWQLDAFEYRLADAAGPTPLGAKVTVYQLLDDSTRFDVGTLGFADPENGTDAITTLDAAFTAHGVPRELLSDNGLAFSQARRGNISATERFLADRGCFGITGRDRHPQTQGKNERSHQTILRFLDANAPDTLERLNALIIDYRTYYNYRRRHQALPGSMTPGQAWDAAEHNPTDGTPISHDVLQARADSYRDKTLATVGDDPRAVDLRETTIPTEHREPSKPHGGRLRDSPDHVVITRSNPQIYFQSIRIKVPTTLVGTYQVVTTETEFMMFDVISGVESIYFPLPLRTEATQEPFPLWQVAGARIRDPKPAWLHKRQAYETEHFPADRDLTSPQLPLAGRFRRL
ncbi:integrase core domain-containing protein [Cryobacterium roopkundense]|uniref:Transposase InsO family protein n=1 Tax=Cryobacterium roopkundense TaxID=1001240 RepID=A0A7W9E4R0_9MICO|nr:integrase core domain-containing protein [Cryobacterium roopkundense]MBB5642937.1 transposase InsO family protein [Cryobacterium roopkundense]